MSKQLVVEAPPRFEGKLPNEISEDSTDDSIAHSFSYIVGEPVAVERKGNRVRVLEMIRD